MFSVTYDDETIQTNRWYNKNIDPLSHLPKLNFRIELVSGKDCEFLSKQQKTK